MRLGDSGLPTQGSKSLDFGGAYETDDEIVVMTKSKQSNPTAADGDICWAMI
jgi:hypothetical protein